ncbi:hypothetical protein [Paramicrobacterium agarici]|uniref:Uncharacterized protein n=1 Tax=Paramicrobacterium agarici TaxID=630514 RepID=A0A2A9DS23_9MICO|nr:hypothetical protein [Microbacterium agarici]PFG29191.1 hypothetical protein ATJ78_0088 [Microbacterium agarici]TQO22155.1 hypothetical protein FB385_0974 [Microbacterium agarici]
MSFTPPPVPDDLHGSDNDDAPVPPSKRRRIWGWIVAGVGITAFAAIAIVAVTSLVASTLPTARPEAAPVPTAEPSAPWGATPTPQPTDTGLGEPPSYDPPPYSAPVDGVYPLSSYAYFEQEVTFEKNLADNWYSETDKFGEYWLSDDPVCNLTADPKWIYIFGDPEPDKNDGYYTARDLDLSEANLRAQFPDLDDHGDDFVVEMPVSDGNTIEFMGRRLDYAGGFFLQLTRGMMWQDSSYGITLSCLGSESFDDEAFAQKIVDQFTMTLN